VGRILITGGAGFIGSAFAKYARNRGLEVGILDNLSSGHKSNFDELSDLGISCVKGDIRDSHLLEEVLNDCHSVVHLAAKVSVPDSIADPEGTIDVNVNGTQTLIDECIKRNLQRFILASSAAVYGDNQSLPLKENNLGTVLSPYAKSKLINEEQLNQLHSIDCQTFALRFFNVYGNGQHTDSGYSAVIPTFVKQMLDREPPILFGNGMQTRDFIHVDDVCSAIFACLNYVGDNVNNLVLNVASQQSTSLLQLIGLINHILSESSNLLPLEPKFSEIREGDIVHSLGSIEEIRTILNWKPEFEIYEGLSKMIQQGRD